MGSKTPTSGFINNPTDKEVLKEYRAVTEDGHELLYCLFWWRSLAWFAYHGVSLRIWILEDCS